MTEGLHMRRAGWIVVGFIASAAAGFAELGDTISPSPDHPAIAYFNYLKHTLRDPVSELNRKLQQGALELQFERHFLCLTRITKNEKGHQPGCPPR